MAFNQITLLGNFTREVETKYTTGGTAIAAFGMATSHKYTSQSGEKREEVMFIDCEAFGRTAEIISKYCKKGHQVFIQGRLKLDTWEDKQSGQKRSKHKVVVETVQLLNQRERQPDDTRTRTPQKPPPQRFPVERDPDLDDLDQAPDDIPF